MTNEEKYQVQLAKMQTANADSQDMTVEDWGTLCDLVWAERSRANNARADSVVVLDALHDKCCNRYHTLKKR